MDKNIENKRKAAIRALDYVEEGMIVGVGTGSTVHYFIEALATKKHDISGVVSSSAQTTIQLKYHGIPIIDPNACSNMALYVDGADEANDHFQLIKGGGGALTGEKILAAQAKTFVCIIDVSKRVRVLGKFPLPIEVIPIARSFVAREIVKLGGDPVYREHFVSDYSNIILDVHNLDLTDPIQMEEKFNNIPGVVTNGLFAKRTADILLIGDEKGVETITKK